MKRLTNEDWKELCYYVQETPTLVDLHRSVYSSNRWHKALTINKFPDNVALWYETFESLFPTNDIVLTVCQWDSWYEQHLAIVEVELEPHTQPPQEVQIFVKFSDNEQPRLLTESNVEDYIAEGRAIRERERAAFNELRDLLDDE